MQRAQGVSSRDGCYWTPAGAQVELWTRRRHLSPVLTRRIRAYYAEVCCIKIMSVLGRKGA